MGAQSKIAYGEDGLNKLDGGITYPKLHKLPNFPNFPNFPILNYQLSIIKGSRQQSPTNPSQAVMFLARCSSCTAGRR